jgi:hypothetical protein
MNRQVSFFREAEKAFFRRLILRSFFPKAKALGIFVKMKKK